VSAEILGTDNGVVTIKISGTLGQTDWLATQKKAAEVLQQQGRSKVLVLADDFDGWEKGGNWGELAGQMELDDYMNRMAIVGDPKWQTLALLFAGKGLRRVDIEYFTPPDLAKAQSWLAAGPEAP
jgi:SpoIIAA-like